MAAPNSALGETNEKVHPSRVKDVSEQPSVDGLLKKEQEAANSPETTLKSSSEEKDSTALKIEDEKKVKDDAPPPVSFFKMFRCGNIFVRFKL